MAKIGDQLLQPEIGWKRYKARNTFPIFNKDKWSTWNTSNGLDVGGSLERFGTENIGEKFIFSFKGTKFRMLSTASTGHSDKGTIKVDGETTVLKMSHSSSTVRGILMYEKIWDKEGTHKIELECKDSSNWFMLDSFDIGESDKFVETLEDNFEFPVKIIEKGLVDTYTKMLINGEQQLIIEESSGNLFLTDGEGGNIPVAKDEGTGGSNIDEQRIIELEKVSHGHINKEVLDNLSIVDNELKYKGEPVINMEKIELQISNLYNATDYINKDIKNIKYDIGVLEDDNKSLKEEVKKISNIETEIESLKSKNTEQDKIIEQLKTLNEESGIKIQELEKSNKDLKENITNIQDSIKQLLLDKHKHENIDILNKFKIADDNLIFNEDRLSKEKDFKSI